MPKPEPVVQKLFKVLEEAKGLRKGLEKVKKVARKPKTAMLAKRLVEAKTFEDIRAARAALKGKLIPEGAEIMPTVTKFTEAEQAELIQTITKSPVLGKLVFTKRNTAEALGDLLQFGKIPTLGQRRNLIRVFGDEFAKIVPAEDIKAWQRFSDVLTEVINTPKTTMSMLDLSASLRQALTLATRHPIEAIRATFGAGAKSGLRQKWFEGIQESIINNRFAPAADAAGLDLTTMGHILKREEAYVSGWLQRLAKNWGTYTLPKKIITAPLWPVGQAARMSERAFIATLNKMRMDIFSRYAALWEGKAGEAELKAMAEVINICSGRGAVGRRLQPLVNLLNNVWFSPRLQISRVQYLGLPFTLWKYPPLVRRYVIGNIVAFYGTIAGTLSMIGLAAKQFGWKDVSIEEDPRSTDVGKIRIGDTRIDPWGGHQQYARLITRLISGEMKTAMGQIKEIDREEELVRFLRLKESPFIGLLHDIFKGESFLGEELTAEPENIQKQAFERTAPFFIRDMIDAIREDGLLGGMAASAGFFGVGVLSYPSATYANWLATIEKKIGRETTDEDMRKMRPDYNKAEASWLEYLELKTAKAREHYRENNPDIEASMYFWGELNTLSSPEAQEEF